LSRGFETSLYAPVKRFLEGLGYTVKGEVGGCDIVGIKGDDPPIVVVGEMKLAFNLELVLQAVDRAPACARYGWRRAWRAREAAASRTGASVPCAGVSASACSR